MKRTDNTLSDVVDREEWRREGDLNSRGKVPTSFPGSRLTGLGHLGFTTGRDGFCINNFSFLQLCFLIPRSCDSIELLIQKLRGSFAKFFLLNIYQPAKLVDYNSTYQNKKRGSPSQETITMRNAPTRLRQQPVEGSGRTAIHGGRHEGKHEPR